MAKYSKFINEVVSSTLGRLQDDVDRRVFAHALKRSIELDIDSQPPNPATVITIESEYGLDSRAQKQYGIAINRPRAEQFLTDFGFIGLNTNKYRNYSKENYEKIFGRAPYMLSGGQLLLTYAEWLHFVKYTLQEPELPSFLQRYLE